MESTPHLDEYALLQERYTTAAHALIDATLLGGEELTIATAERDRAERELQLLENRRAMEAGETPPHVQHLGTVRHTEGSSDNWILHGGSRRVDVTGGQLSPDYGSPRGSSPIDS